jgi:hypothetical protein
MGLDFACFPSPIFSSGGPEVVRKSAGFLTAEDILDTPNLSHLRSGRECRLGNVNCSHQALLGRIMMVN